MGVPYINFQFCIIQAQNESLIEEICFLPFWLDF